MLKTLLPNKGWTVLEQGTSADHYKPTSPLWSIPQVSRISSNSQPALPSPAHPRLRPLSSMCAWSSNCAASLLYPLPRLSHVFLLQIGHFVFKIGEEKFWGTRCTTAVLQFISHTMLHFTALDLSSWSYIVPPHRIVFSQPSLQTHNSLSKSRALN